MPITHGSFGWKQKSQMHRVAFLTYRLALHLHQRERRLGAHSTAKQTIECRWIAAALHVTENCDSRIVVQRLFDYIANL